MPDVKQFKLPDVGEGLTEAEIVSWKVKPGDAVKVNDIVVEIETAKSLVELPSPFAGVVSELLVEEGRTVDVGTPIISVDTDPNGAAAPAKERPADDMSAGVASGVPTPKDDEAVEPGLIGGPAPGGRTSVLVGYGPRSTEAKRRPRKGSAVPGSVSAAAAQEAVQTTAEPAPAPTPEPAVSEVVPSVPAGAAASTAGFTGATVSVLAKPPVRKLAKDLGVDLATVAPTGSGGIITRSDVEAAAGGAAVSPVPATTVAADGRRETRVPIKGVRKMTAQAMVSSAFTAPHVTEFITVDVTASLELLDKLKARAGFAGVRLSPLVLVMKALLISIARNPEINATWDEAAQEIVVKHYVNLGIAAATPRGLIVPNIKDAQAMNLAELATALGELVATAREGKTQPADMAGGTITITNVGVFGVDTGTPILNPGESAILAFGAIRDMPWVVDGAIVPRKITQLALSFDHRLVDGELGSRFLADLAAVLSQPELALAWS